MRHQAVTVHDPLSGNAITTSGAGIRSPKFKVYRSSEHVATCKLAAMWHWAVFLVTLRLC